MISRKFALSELLLDQANATAKVAIGEVADRAADCPSGERAKSDWVHVRGPRFHDC
jgi:hypothetical protein